MIALFIIDHIQHYHPFVWSSANPAVGGSSDVGQVSLNLLPLAEDHPKGHLHQRFGTAPDSKRLVEKKRDQRLVVEQTGYLAADGAILSTTCQVYIKLSSLN